MLKFQFGFCTVIATVRAANDSIDSGDKKQSCAALFIDLSKA